MINTIYQIAKQKQITIAMCFINPKSKVFKMETASDENELRMANIVHTLTQEYLARHSLYSNDRNAIQLW
jgi:hypothetical protein